MFCPECGEQIPEGSRFCGACGADLTGFNGVVTPSGGTPASGVATSSGGSGTPAGPRISKTVVGAAIAAIVVAIVALVLFNVVGGNSDNAYVYLSDGEYMLVTDLDEAEAIEIDSSRSDYTSSYLLTFGPSGKYVYYYTKYDTSTGTGTLCRAEYGKLKADSDKNDDYIETIASDVYDYECLDDDTVVYLDDEDTLYFFDGNDTTELADSVNYFYTDGSERVVYTSGTYDEGYKLYGLNVTDPDSEVKLASGCTYFYSFDDVDNIYYTEVDDDYNETLYVVGFDKEPEQLGENVQVLNVDYEDATIYFTAENGKTVSLYDYVDDSYASADAGITLPDENDYLTSTYTYNQLYSSDDEGDYDEIYTTCSNYVYFFSGAIEDETSSSYELAQEFTEKYLATENSDGYFLVTDEIKDELQEMCDEYGQGYDGEWLEFCFYREAVIDEEAYDDAYEEYEEVADRIIIRETLQDGENDYALKTLYCYADGTLTAVAENVLSTSIGDAGFVYNTVGMVTETIDIESVYSTSDVTDLFSIDYSAQNYLLSYGSIEPVQLSETAAEDVGDLRDAGYVELCVVGSTAYMYAYDYTTYECDLYYATIESGTVGEFSLLSEDMNYAYVDDTGIYYDADSYTNGDYEYADLYRCVDGESELLAENIYGDSYNIYDDGVILAYTEFDSNGYDFELTMTDAEGESTVIAEDVSFYTRTADGGVMYISDDDLYYYDGKESTRIARDVDCCWVQNTKEEIELTYFLGVY